MKAPAWVWRRQIAEAQTDEWLEQLDWVGPQRVMVLAKPGSTRARVEVYGPKKSEAQRLLKLHGGKIRPVPVKALLRPAPPRPIRVSPALYISGDDKAARKLRQNHPCARVLLICASMAFGSGEHATTGMVLRHLGRRSRSLVRGATVLDLGTGSGILALAARALEAARIVAIDNDPHCVRISRENERANFGRSAIRWQRAELGAYQPGGRFSLVTANLFSDLLIAQSKAIWSFVAVGGCLLLSGILKHQAAGVIGAFRQLGARLTIHHRKGKWAMLAFGGKGVNFL